MELKDRLKILFKAQKLTQEQFAEILDIGQSTLNNYLNGASKPNFKNVMSLLVAFPSLSANWLLKGEGDMFMNLSENEFIKKINQNSDNSELQEDQVRYGQLKEKTIIIEKLCGATGGKCYFDALKEANERISELEKELEKKNR